MMHCEELQEDPQPQHMMQKLRQTKSKKDIQSKVQDKKVTGFGEYH